jgi:energy-coupling factor transport system permease protein
MRTRRLNSGAARLTPRSALAYSPRPGPLSNASALAASAYLGSLAVVAFIYSNPIVLAAAGAAVVIAGLAAGARSALLLAGRWTAALGVLIVIVNAIASQRGETILVRGWDLPVLGQVDVSGEALVEGAILALRIGVVFAAFAVHSTCVDPDRTLRLLRPVARHSALTATLITRMVPLAAADHARLRDAQALRGPAAAPVGRAALVRRLVAGSLDRAVDVAATLELRGYGRGLPRRAAAPRASRHSWRFAAAGLAIAALGVGARIAGAGSYEAYPTVVLDTDLATLALAAALPLLAAAPFAGIGHGRGRRRRA